MVVAGAISCSDPDLKASCLLVAYLATKVTFHYVRLGALASLMANLIALETQLGITVEAIVRVLTAQDAIGSTTFVGTLASHVTKLLAIAAFNSRVRVCIVPSHAILHP